MENLFNFVSDSYSSLLILLPVLGALVTILDWLRNHKKIISLSDPTHLTLLSNVTATVFVLNEFYILAYVAYITHLLTLINRFSRQATTYNAHSDLVKFQKNLVACVNPIFLLLATVNMHGMSAYADQYGRYVDKQIVLRTQVVNLYDVQDQVLDLIKTNNTKINELQKLTIAMDENDNKLLEVTNEVAGVNRELLTQVESLAANQRNLLSIQTSQIATIEHLRSKIYDNK